MNKVGKRMSEEGEEHETILECVLISVSRTNKENPTVFLPTCYIRSTHSEKVNLVVLSEAVVWDIKHPSGLWDHGIARATFTPRAKLTRAATGAFKQPRNKFVCVKMPRRWPVTLTSNDLHGTKAPEGAAALTSWIIISGFSTSRSWLRRLGFSKCP